MREKVCMVTGATSGIGKEVAIGLANTGSTIVLVCRDYKKGRSTEEEITRKTGNKKISILLADFSSLASIKEMVKDFKKQYKYLDVLINNAGVLNSKRILTKDGYETTFQVNYIAPFLLTNLLVDTLKKSRPSRVINITSDEHSRGSIDFDDLQWEKHYGGYWAYARSKLALVLFTYQLSERLNKDGVSVNCVHPGSVATNIGRNSSGIMGLYFKFGKHFMLNPEEGAKTIVYLATSPEVKGMTGKYFMGKNVAKSSELSYNKELANKLWDKTAEMLKMKEIIQ